MGKEDYEKLISLVEKKRKKLIEELEKGMYSKKIAKDYLNKYDALLLRLYTKYGEF